MELIKRQIHLGSSDVHASDRLRIEQVLSSGQFSPGPFCKEFEEKFAAYLNRKHALFVNSGTDALRLSLLAMKEKYGWKDTDYVAVPALTFVATVNIVLQARMRPMFIDICMTDLMMNSDNLEHYLTPNLKAVIPVHLFGACAFMPRIMEVAKKGHLKVLEDSCETVGAWSGAFRVAPKMAGQWGEAACFSTYQCHIMATGVGGIAVTDDDDLHEIMRSLANHGRDPVYLPGYRTPALSKELLSKRFRFIRDGYSCRPDEFQGALALGQLARLEENLVKRREIAHGLLMALKPYEDFLQLPWNSYPYDDKRMHSYMMFPLVLKADLFKKEDLCWHLEEAGIETRDLMPIVNQPLYADYFNGTYACGMARFISERGFYIPCHPQMTLEDVEYIASVFAEFFAVKKRYVD